MPESAAKSINRRKISNTNNGGDGNDSKTTRRSRPGTYNTRWAGFGSTSPNGGTTFMCVAAIACCGMPACANGQIHAQETNPPRQWCRWPRLGRWSSFWGAPRTSSSISLQKSCKDRGYERYAYFTRAVTGRCRLAVTVLSKIDWKSSVTVRDAL